jgi:hypothetical protein
MTMETRQLTLRSRPCHSFSRSLNFWILPVAVFGSSPKATDLGALKRAKFSLQNSMISFAVGWLPGLVTTNALGTSPHLESKRPWHCEPGILPA